MYDGSYHACVYEHGHDGYYDYDDGVSGYASDVSYLNNEINYVSVVPWKNLIFQYCRERIELRLISACALELFSYLYFYNFVSIFVIILIKGKFISKYLIRRGHHESEIRTKIYKN